MNSKPFGGEAWYRDPRVAALCILGATLVGSGFAHAIAWAMVGGPWEGPVTWRKPILFGISAGLTSISLGWVWSKLPCRRADRWLADATAWALFVEVFLIDLQKWRGVASHFNRSTALDSFLYDAMGGLIIFVTLVICDLTVRLFRQPGVWSSDMLLATRAGMILLVVSCGLGIWVSVHGELQLEAGLDPERYGAAGVPKFPHGVVIHAIQWLPVIAWAARRLGLGERVRVRLIGLATAVLVLMLAFALSQTLTGHSRFDLSWWAALIQ